MAYLDQLVSFYRDGYTSGGFEVGVETALRALLASPEFLFRIERDPEGALAGTPYHVSDLELATRLSFFLWSAPPDEALLQIATAGQLSDPSNLEAEVLSLIHI